MRIIGGYIHQPKDLIALYHHSFGSMHHMEAPEASTADSPGLAPGSQKTRLLLQQFKDFYSQFSAANISQIDTIYTQDIEFHDPVHCLQGQLAVKAYLRKMAAGLKHYRIRYLDELVGEDNAYFTWEMEFAHKSLAGGEVITIRGMTRIRFTSKIFHHEDCYDLGALVYEQVPVLRTLTRQIKKRLAG